MHNAGVVRRQKSCDMIWQEEVFHGAQVFLAMNERGDRSVVQEAVALFPEGWRTAYLVILGMLLGVGLGIAALEEFLWHGKIEFVVRILAVAGHGGGVAPVSVLLAVFLTEAWRSMALLSEKLRDRIRDQGRAEASSNWRKWFDRYEEARRKGVPFNEPPPDKG